MNKFVKFIQENKKNIGIIVVFFISILSFIITKNLDNLDEVWVFNTARNIANGLLPYKDFNLVTTPGLPIICGIILKIFGTQLFYMRIMAVILCTVIAYMIYKNLKILKINEEVSLFATLGSIWLFKDYFCIDYNFFILCIALVLLYSELKISIKNELFTIDIKHEIFVGILAGIAVLMKQTAGIIFAFCIICYKFFYARNKNEFKTALKIIFYRGLAFLIPILFLVIYFTFNNIWSEFFNYAILGIKEFTNKISYSELLDGEFKVLAIIFPIIIAILFIISLKTKEKNLIILFAYSVSTVIIVYPISDKIHFLISATVSLISGVYLIYLIYEKFIQSKLNKKFRLYVNELLSSIAIVTMIYLGAYSCGNVCNVKYDNNTNFANLTNIPIDDGLKNVMKNVDDYIMSSSKEVYIVDSRSAIFMIPINRYNKNYDMFLIGNMGKNGSNNMIDEIKNKENIELLILNDNMSLNWQTPVDVIYYIKNNMNKIGQIEYFDIYSTIEN